MRTSRFSIFASIAAIGAALLFAPVKAQNARFRNAPESADATNPVAGQADAVHQGLELFADHCSSCHGIDRKGSGSIPALDTPRVSSANDGELFWFITNGDTDDGMPSWKRLPDEQRWQIVAFLKSSSAASNK